MSEGFEKIKKLKVDKDTQHRNKIITNPKQNFTVTEESADERIDYPSAQKINDMKGLDHKNSKDIKKLEIVLDESQLQV